MEDLENRKPEEIEENKELPEEKSKGGIPMRTYIIMILAGAYVAYLGVSLCQNVIKGVEGSNAGFMVAGVIFVVLGVGFVINGIRGSMKVSKAQKEQAEAEAKQAQASEADAVEETSGIAGSEMENTSSQGKKMSIADRANLVSHLGDGPEDEEE